MPKMLEPPYLTLTKIRDHKANTDVLNALENEKLNECRDLEIETKSAQFATDKTLELDSQQLWKARPYGIRSQRETA
ncbi:hypothetical protein LBWT_31160 [Leptolyngbya boryana IAM M-101]|nr:hypothetical protein LBWT_31160 [Leptolyngbya boryana IAM M-101]BAS63511.1 hypothetical protein LBDG_31160 [Leptolyngbya boryana dg5]